MFWTGDSPTLSSLRYRRATSPDGQAFKTFSLDYLTQYSVPSDDAGESPVALEPLFVGALVKEAEVEPLLAGHVRQHLVDLALALVPADGTFFSLFSGGGGHGKDLVENTFRHTYFGSNKNDQIFLPVRDGGGGHGMGPVVSA